MYKKTPLLLLLLCGISFSQEMITAIPMALKKDRDVFQIVDQTNKKVILFLSDKENVKAIRLDADMKVIDSTVAYRPDPDFTDMIGYNHNGQDYRLYWATSNGKEIYSQGFNFNGSKVLAGKHTLPLKAEKIVQKFSENNNFYILTALKNSNVIKLYTFHPDGIMDTKTLDLQGFHFFTSEYKRTDFYNSFSSEREIKKINPDSPTSLTDSSKKTKFYFQDNKIILTLDGNADYTQLITIDLATFTATEKYLKQPFVSFMDRSQVNSNSFLCNGKLYQIRITSSEMVVVLKDLNDKLLKHYRTTSGQIINYKNSDIVQENGDIKNTRILERTEQFLRKINNAYVGLSCYNMDGNSLVTIGSVSDVQDSGAMMVGGMFGVAGVLLAYAISNPTLDNFNAYANRKVVYINCLFDENGNHVATPLKPLAFDNIRKFLSENKKTVASETLYKFDSSYYLGFYNTREKKYELTKFNE